VISSRYAAVYVQFESSWNPASHWQKRFGKVSGCSLHSILADRTQIYNIQSSSRYKANSH